MLFLSLMHMAGGLNVQKGLCEGISRKLELCTSPDTGTCPKQLAASPFFHFHSLPPHSSSTFSPSPCFFFFSFPYSFLSLNHPSPSPDVALFRHICFAQADSWPAQSWCHDLFKEENHELFRGLTVMSFVGGKIDFLFQDQQACGNGWWAILIG